MRDSNGNLTPEAIDLLNKASREVVSGVPHEMYPLSQLAADMGRACLLTVSDAGGADVTGLASRQRWDRKWRIYVARDGWQHVTDPEALAQHRREETLKRLRDAPMPEFMDSRLSFNKPYKPL